jgi:diguanylate cyclase (GGDEF)-like protein/PAS domain S-box-containing protein
LRRRGTIRLAQALAGLSIALTVVVLDRTGLTRDVDRWLYDALAEHMAPSPPADVVLVAIDETSLAEVGRWPWPRRIHAELIRRLAARGAAAIGIDVIFSESDATDPAGDTLLAMAIVSAGNVVLPVYREMAQGRSRERRPLPVLAAAAAGLGHVGLTPDEDGRLRRFRLVEAGRPSLPVAMLALAGHAVPAVDEALLPSPHGASHVRRLSAAAVLRDDPLQRDLEGAVVLVGVTAAGLAPRTAWPDAPGGIAAVEVQAAAIGAIRQNVVVVPLPEPWRTGGLLLLGMGVGLVLGRERPGRALPLTALLIVGAAPAALLLLGHRLLPLATPALASGLGLTLWVAARWLRERHRLRSEQRRAELTLRSVADAVVTADATGRIDSVNPAAERLLGRRRRQLLGQPLDEAVRLLDSDRSVAASRLCDEAPVSASLTLVDLEGRRRAVRVTAAPMRRGRHVTGCVLALSDVTLEHHLMREVSHRATHDDLTGLPNRSLLRDRLEHALARARRDRSHGAVVMLDLDRFKAVNDALGHASGDALLAAVAKRLMGAKREADTLSRLGGDEFVLMLEAVAHEADALAAAERYRATLRQPFAIDGHALHVMASFGISLFPRDGREPDELLRNADLAMYRAKRSLPGSILFFAAEMNAKAMERLALDRELRQAVERREFELHYQPQLAIDRRRLVGVECLVRWRHPTRGLLAPASFVPLAEETGLICDIGRQVLADGCRQLSAWTALDPALRLSVNLSVVQLKADEGLVRFVAETMQGVNLDCRRLELEVTESLFLDPRLATLSARLRELTEAGVRLSIDDFGTGYSSLAYLRRFPFDRIKIDRSFVQDVEHDRQACAIVHSIIGLGHSLGKPITAEGVETEGQLRFLHREGCDEAQGYLLGRPGRPETIDTWLH